MQKNSIFLIITVLALVFIQIAGCKKNCDTIPPNEAELCDIKHIQYTFASQKSEANFTYNTHGDPVSITVSNPGTGNPNVIFLYDHYNRITDYIEPYSKLDPANLPNEIAFEFWIRYTYADQNPSSLPVVDTSRTFGYYKNGQFSVFTPTNIEHYTYDSKGRISQISTSNLTVTYNYNANGNLVLPNVMYDDKINFRRTNKLWMFLDRDYSMNNMFIATSYNDKGLPLTIPNSYSNFLHRVLFLSSIEYSCNINMLTKALY